MRDYNAYLERKRSEFGERFDTTDLDPTLIPYFNSGERIRVKTKYGGNYTGTIGVTTGWKPVFLLITRKDAMGSSITLPPGTIVLARKIGRKYVPVQGA